MLNLPPEHFGAAVGFILNQRQEALVMIKDDGYPWQDNLVGLFGGKIEGDEQPIDAFGREVVEEMGPGLIQKVTYLFEHPFADTHKNNQRTRNGKLYVHAAQFTGNISDIRLQEGAGFAFISEKSLPRFPLATHNLEALQKAYALLKEGKIPGYPHYQG